VANDFTVALAYLNPTLQGAAVAPATIAIDGSDNVWVLGAANASYNYITEQLSSSAGGGTTNTLGTTAALAATNNIRNAAFDTLGNLWMADGTAANPVLIEIPSGSSAAAATQQAFTNPTSGTTSYLDPNDYTVVVDGSNNVWTASYGAQGNCIPLNTTSSANVCEYLELQKGASSYTGVNTFGSSATQESAPSVRGMAADANSAPSYSAYNGRIWAANYGVLSATKGATTTPGNAVGILVPSTGTLYTPTVGATGAGTYGVALDATSSGWVTTTTIPGLYYVSNTSTSTQTVTAATAASPSTVASTTTAPASTATTAVAIGGLNGPTYDAVDGKGNVFVANPGYLTVVEYSPANSAYLSPFYGFAPSIARPAETVTPSTYTLSSKNATSVSFTGTNLFAPGDIVTFSGFTDPNLTVLNGKSLPVASGGLSGTTFQVTQAFTNGSKQTAVALTAGTAAAPAYAQSQFVCTTGTTKTCSITGASLFSTSIAIDRAGTIWTLSPNGTVVSIFGVAAPTDPVLADGAYGALP
jgi:hypothetical protein